MAQSRESPAAAEIVYQDRQLRVTRTDNPPGLRLTGEIDIFNSSAVTESMRATLTDPGDPHLDVTGLVFCDISGLRSLVNLSRSLGPTRRVLLHGLAPDFTRVIEVTGWSDDPGLAMCACEWGAE